MLAGLTWLISGAVLVFSLFWKGKTRESVPYRMIQAGLGLVAGILAYGMAGTGEVLEISISKPGVMIEVPVWARVLLFYMVAMFSRSGGRWLGAIVEPGLIMLQR